MRIVSLITSHWNTPEEFESKCAGRFGLDGWLANCSAFFNPVRVIVACGTWSEPRILYHRWRNDQYRDYIQVVNSGTEWYGPYDVIWRHYALAATVAGFLAALSDNDWDILVQLDNDVLVGDVDFDKLLREFMSRPEELLTPSWCGCWPGGPFWAWKRAGVSRFVNHRTRANFIDEKAWTSVPGHGDRPHLSEEEMFYVMNGHWWNPWGHIPSMRQDFGQEAEAHLTNEQAMSWPFVRMPHPDIIERYSAENSPKTKCVKGTFPCDPPAVGG